MKNSELKPHGSLSN